jgi:glucoamylase
MKSYFMANINIQGKGGIVAAPDYNTPGGSYYCELLYFRFIETSHSYYFPTFSRADHWMRDGALTMRSLQETNSGNFTAIESTLKQYAQWVLTAQARSDPNGQDVRTEPKFELPNGEVFSGAWCRPQNDGPGLQATSLIMLANSLIAQGESSYVSQYLWTGSSSNYNGGAIKYDLDYVVSGYNSNTCDLWEEIRDPDLFWNRITMKKAMLVGAEFAAKVSYIVMRLHVH